MTVTAVLPTVTAPYPIPISLSVYTLPLDSAYWFMYSNSIRVCQAILFLESKEPLSPNLLPVSKEFLLIVTSWVNSVLHYPSSWPLLSYLT